MPITNMHVSYAVLEAICNHLTELVTIWHHSDDELSQTGHQHGHVTFLNSRTLSLTSERVKMLTSNFIQVDLDNYCQMDD